ncbi:hypothetical protein RJ641_032087 [Dillenia turbinata]|uniref:ZCF37 n=1 Tax=Dillenia turbinata TaxID=194707 RepID=A0AAN8ZF65_9MAGN
MVNPFVCGTFPQEVEEDHEPSSPCFSPKKNKTSMSRSNGGNNKNKNPYALGGLDKFSMLLAELEEKRLQIYSQKGSDDISLVRFVYPDSNDCVPIVVKMKDKDKHKQNKLRDHIEDKPVEEISVDKFLVNSSASASESNENAKNQKKTTKFSRDTEINRWGRPAYYLPAILILILLSMAVFGRSVAVCCTSIGWYLVPRLPGGNSNPRKPMKKKVYGRRFNEIKVSNNNHNNNKSGDGKDSLPANMVIRKAGK